MAPQPTAAPTAVPPTATPRPAPTAEPTSQAGPSGTVKIAVNGLGTEVWVGRRQTGGTEQQGTYLLNETLVGTSQLRELVPRLAAEWSVEAAPGDVVWTFRLQEGVEFHGDAGEMTAEDWQFTWSELLKEDAKASDAPQIRDTIDKDISNFEIVSPYEFKLHGSDLNVILPFTLSPLANASTPQSKAYYDAVGEDAVDRHPVGTGPFEFVSHDRGSKVEFEAVLNHWRKTPEVQAATLFIVPEAAGRLAMLRTGQADLAPMALSFKPELVAAGLKLIPVENQINVFVALGGMYPDLPEQYCTECPWVGSSENALKVREALTIAIDRDAIVTSLLSGEAKVAAAPFAWTPGPYAFNDPSWEVPAFDPDRARQLLTEAGYPNGFEIDIALFPLGGFPGLPDVGEAVANFWDDIGIQVNRMPMDFTPTFRTRMGDRTTAGFAWPLYISFADEPLRNMRSNFSSTGGAVYLTDPVIDEFIAAASVESDRDKRLELTRELGQYMIDQRLGIPLFAANGIWGAGSKFVSWDNIVGHPFLNNVETIVVEA
jgi:peptide/nickel transport system substrate-binding protein